MSTVGDRIKALRKEIGMSQDELAKKVGYQSRGSINKIETGICNVTQKKIKAIADALESTPEYLMGWDTGPPPPQPSALHIPVLGSVNAGIPLYAIENIVDWEDIPISMGSSDREYFGLKVRGDSMYPDYHEGDTIIVRRTPDFESGSVCVVYVNGYDATLKQVRRNPDLTITLIPRNPEYAPKTYNPSEITVCGVVVELRRKI